MTTRRFTLLNSFSAFLHDGETEQERQERADLAGDEKAKIRAEDEIETKEQNEP